MSRSALPAHAETDCLICEARNSGGAVICRQCGAPLALAQQAAAEGQLPLIVSVLGDSNVGKTVYLGFLLDMLTQRAGNYEAVPQGAYAVDLPQIVISHMAHRMFPPKTPMESNEWNWAYYRVARPGRRRKWIDLVMPDLAGEALAAELATPRTFQVIDNLLARSAGLLLLVDAALAANGSARPDFFALKMLSHVDGLFAGKRRRRIGLPIAVVLTKADHCPECFEDPGRFVRANLGRLWNLCASRFERVAFFPVSVVGALGYATAENEDFVVPVPLHTALRGVLEPFEWIVTQL